jgi:hypothetical protein
MVTLTFKKVAGIEFGINEDKIWSYYNGVFIINRVTHIVIVLDDHEFVLYQISIQALIELIEAKSDQALELIFLMKQFCYSGLSPVYWGRYTPRGASVYSNQLTYKDKDGIQLNH